MLLQVVQNYRKYSKRLTSHPFLGKQVAAINIPSTMTTSVCFGGPQYEKLYVTTTSVDVDLANTPIKGQPDAGKIFAVSSDKDNSFKGFAHYFFQP